MRRDSDFAGTASGEATAPEPRRASWGQPGSRPGPPLAIRPLGCPSVPLRPRPRPPTRPSAGPQRRLAAARRGRVGIKTPAPPAVPSLSPAGWARAPLSPSGPGASSRRVQRARRLRSGSGKRPSALAPGPRRGDPESSPAGWRVLPDREDPPAAPALASVPLGPGPRLPSSAPSAGPPPSNRNSALGPGAPTKVCAAPWPVPCGGGRSPQRHWAPSEDAAVRLSWNLATLGRQ